MDKKRAPVEKFKITSEMKAFLGEFKKTREIQKALQVKKIVLDRQYQTVEQLLQATQLKLGEMSKAIPQKKTSEFPGMDFSPKEEQTPGKPMINY